MGEKNTNNKTNEKVNNLDEEALKIKNELRNERKEQEQRKNAKKSKKRMYIVLLFILVVVLVGYVIFRGEYLEILEIGEEYISIFWQNVNYTAITFGINFIILFIIIYMNNNRIKKALKPFFELEKKPMPKLPNKSISFIISLLSVINNNAPVFALKIFSNPSLIGVPGAISFKISVIAFSFFFLN